jgi:ATP-dependent Clp protease, protease subunit
MIGRIIPLDPGARWPDRVEDAALSLLLRRRIVFLRGAIQGNVAGDVAAQLLALDGIGAKPISLIIDSPGGDVSGLFTILDTMGMLDAKVNTRCVGMAASGAAVILGAGTGVRSATPNARIMLHQPHGGIQGASAKDLEIAAKEFLFLKARLEEILSERTHQPLERIREDTDRDFWMSAGEAKDYGLIDRVGG